MPGGFLQLTTYQESGADLTNANPNITFFKTVFKQYTNFAVENISVQFNDISNISFTEPIELNCELDNIGHILQNIYLVVDIPRMAQDNTLKPQWIPNLGIHMIKSIQFIIAGEPVQTFSDDWLNIYYKRYMTYERFLTAQSQINVEPSPNKDFYVNLQNRLYVYLPFWFSKDSGLGLPLLNIEYQSIYIKIIIRPIREWLTVVETTQGSPYLGKRIAPYGNYITQIERFFSRDDLFHFEMDAHVVFLENSEFHKMRHSQISYLIEQNQEIIVRGVSEKVIDISLNSRIPMKEIWLLGMRDDIYSRNGWGQYTTLDRLQTRDGELIKPYNLLFSQFTPTDFLQQYWTNYYNTGILPVFNIISGIEIYLDEQIRLKNAPAPFLSLAQPYMNHLNYNQVDYMYNYSFSLEPLQYQPSGFLNMDRVHKALLRVFLTEKPPLKPLTLIPRNVLYKNPKNGGGLYVPNPAEFQPYNNAIYAYLFDIKVIIVNYNLLRIKSGMADLVIRR